MRRSLVRPLIGLLALGAILLQASPASAQRGGGHSFSVQPIGHMLEITGYYGYAWTWSQDITVTYTVPPGGPGGQSSISGSIDIKDSPYYGVGVDITARPGLQIQLLYTRQDSDLTFRVNRRDPTEDLTAMTTEYWHIGGVGGLRQDKFMGITSFTLGGTHYNWDQATDSVLGPIPAGDNWRFSVILGLGAKYFASEKVGLRFDARLPITFTGGGVGIGTGGLSLVGTGIAQFTVSGGLFLALGD